MHGNCDPVLFLQDATIVRPGGETVFRGLNWTIHEGETWAMVGPVGSGKTSLAEVLLGRLHVEAGAIGWPFIDRLRATGGAVSWPSDVIKRVSFREESWLFSYARHYYQQRFNFIEPRDDLTLDTFLRAGTSASDDALRAAAGRLGISDLLSLSLIKLSNGQMRRARIARALLAKPELLILDEPFMGLDAAGRREVAEFLGGLLRDGLRVVLITRPETVPAWVTHVLELGRLVVRWQGPRTDCGLQIADCRFEALRLGASNLQSAMAVLGPNGSGKSTLLSLLCGDHPQAYCNDIRLFGRQRGSGESIWEIKRNIGLVSPELHLYFTEPLTAFRAAASGFFDVLAARPTTPAQDATVRELFDHFGILALAERPFARLSTGEQRLVLLIRALVKAPPLLILDEPFQGLDGRLIARLRDWLDRRLHPDQTLLFVSHYAEEIPRTLTHRLRLEEGRVIERG
ncbi:MAG: ATP-binding cassette domain-containing protein [Planctomycetes bacterium]|nr:ATP-binding cassette domain-containing protein [Planctomycetota bacterium]